MLQFPDNLYTDVRMESVHHTSIRYADGEIQEARVRRYEAAFLRVFDGQRWYHEAVSGTEGLQERVDRLAALATPQPALESHPVLERLQSHQDQVLSGNGPSVTQDSLPAKRDLLDGVITALQARPAIRSWMAGYLDLRQEKRFQSSLGADLAFDWQRAGVWVQATWAEQDRQHLDTFSHAARAHSGLEEYPKALERWLAQGEEILRHSRPVRAGAYPVVLAPGVAGVFAHECFGHKSEADFMVGDAAAQAEWALGKKVGAEGLSIVDGGPVEEGVNLPFDDEGTRTRRTYLIRDGVLAGRLHSAVTAAALGEEATGNGRASSYRFEPIPRQLNTLILPGSATREELLAGIDDGIYVDWFRHGSGMSTFTIAPSRAYRIVGGRIAEPVRVSVVTGSVFGALAAVDGLSDELEVFIPPTGGCGKGEQQGLPVGFGGPYVRISRLNVA